MIVVVSAKGGGATVSALAMALAGPRPTLLAECDTAGGSIRSGYLQGGIGGEVGLAHLAQADREGRLPEAFEAQLRWLDAAGNRLYLPGLTDPLQAAALERTWQPLGALLQAMDQVAGYDVVVDAGRVVFEPGRVHPRLFPAALLHAADVVVLVVRNTLTSVAQTVPVARALRAELDEHGSGADALQLLMIREGPLQSSAIAERMQTPVIAPLPWDERAAHVLTQGAAHPKLTKLPLLRQTVSVVRVLHVATRDRRRRLQAPPVAVASPMVAGVLSRLTSVRTEVAAGG